MGAKLNLDEGGKHKFKHELTGYGTVLIGGDADSRKSEMLRHMDEPVIVVDGADVDEARDVWVSILLGAYPDDLSADELKDARVSSRKAKQALIDTDSGVLLHGFDEMDSEVQTDVAQHFKGIAEGVNGLGVKPRGIRLAFLMNFEQEIGFTAVEGNPVVRAERDLSMRVRTWELESEE